jgi:hypothetical protein
MDGRDYVPKRGGPGFDKKLSGAYTSELLVLTTKSNELCNQLYYKSNSAYCGHAQED